MNREPLNSLKTITCKLLAFFNHRINELLDLSKAEDVGAAISVNPVLYEAKVFETELNFHIAVLTKA